MSAFVHCPDCRCAYDATRARGCPRCGNSLADPGDFDQQVLEAADRLAGLLAGASEAQLLALRETLDRELSGGAEGEWRRPLLRAIQDRSAPTALVHQPRVELASLDARRTAASAAMLFAVVSRLAQLARPTPSTRRSLSRRALALARRAWSAL